jgi:hypothetical protein
MNEETPTQEVPPDWRNKLVHMSPRWLKLGDRLLLPAAYPETVGWSVSSEHLSGPITWLTDMSQFRSGYGINGAMKVCLTDNDVPVEIVYDFYGIDFVTVYAMST